MYDDASYEELYTSKTEKQMHSILIIASLNAIEIIFIFCNIPGFQLLVMCTFISFGYSSKIVHGSGRDRMLCTLLTNAVSILKSHVKLLTNQMALFK